MALTRIVSEIIQDNTIENRDISGSFTAGISGSWRGELSSSNMTDVGGGVSGSVTSTGSFGRVEAAGVVFADSFESVTGGATIDFNDNVNLTGNLTATGNISSSFTSTGSFGRVQTTNIDIDSISGNWTNAGNTVADLGTVTTVDINGGTVDGITSLTAGGNLDIGAHGFRSSTLTADSQTSGRVAIYSTAGLLSEDSDLTFSGATLSATNVTTTGTIKDFASVSGSYVSTGSVGRIQTRAAAIGTITGTTLSVTGNISSSATSTGSVGRLETQQTNASLGGSIINLAGNLTTAGTLTTQNNNVTINAAGAARTLTLNESLTVGDGHDGILTYSAASKTLTVENTSVVNQDLTSDASPTFAGGTISGNLSVGGIFTAQEVHTEFESASVLFTSGSTRFGNDTTDVHRVTGSMDISGSLKIPHGNVTVTDTLTSTNIGAFNLTGKLTAGSTEIEGSAFDINGGTIDGITSLTAGGDLDIGAHDLRAATITADSLTATRVPFAGTAGVLSDDSDLTFATATLSATNLTTTGTIKNMTLVSGSSVSTGSFGNVNVSLDLDVDGTSNLDIVDIDGAVNMAADLTMGANILMADDTSIGIADDAERIEFDGAGDISVLGANLGIGDTSPDELLHVTSTGTEARVVVESSVGKWAIGSEDDDIFGVLNYGTSTPFKIAGNAATNALVVSGSGVGIGTSAPIGGGLDILGDEEALVVRTGDSGRVAIALKNSTTGDATNFTSGVQLKLDSDESFHIVNQTNQEVQIHTSGSERVRIGAAGGLSIAAAFTNVVDNNPDSYQLSFGGDNAANPRWGFRVTNSTDGENLRLDSNLNVSGRECRFEMVKTSGAATFNMSSSFETSLTLENQSGTHGSVFRFYNDSQSPANNDYLGGIIFNGNDDAGNETTFAKIFGMATSVGNGDEDGALTFETANNATSAEHMRITNVGRVGIARDAPGHRLHLYGNDGDADATYLMKIEHDGGAADDTGMIIRVGQNTPSGAGDCLFMLFQDGDGTNIGGIRCSSTPANPEFFNGSDKRMKNNIADTKIKGLDSINALKLREWEWNAPDKNIPDQKIGLVADELEEVFPEWVDDRHISEGWEHCIKDGEPDLKDIPTNTELTYVIAKAVQELSEKNEALEKRIKELEN